MADGNFSRRLFSTLFGKRLPITAGSLSVKGITGELRIVRDTWGIPHIYAEHDNDAWFGLGFCQGQDRAFQIDMLVRAGRGRLSEWIGAHGVEADRIFRRLGLFRGLKERFEYLDDDIKQIMRSFMAGMNEGKRVGLKKRPHEYVLLKQQPSQLLPEDCLIIGGLMSFLLPSNWDCELTRAKILMEDGIEALRAAEPGLSSWHGVTVPPGGPVGEVWDHLAEMTDTLRHRFGIPGASNNWVLSGKNTKSGRPLLANDPHLAPIMPGHWYLAHLKTPRWGLAGGGLVGSPSMASGHNGKISWGVTSGVLDTTDLFVEQISDDGLSYREGDGWEKLTFVDEVIEVKGKKSFTERVPITKRGPVISPALSVKFPALSIKGTFLEPQKTRGIVVLHEVENFEDFRKAFEGWASLPLNFVYADALGNIGYQLAGLPPKRKRGVGALPEAGWEVGEGWDGLQDFSVMPFAKNPAEGFLATANNIPVAWNDCAEILGVDWFDGFRFGRIVEVLKSRKDWDIESCLKLQMDQTTQVWSEFKEPLLRILSNAKNLSPAEQQCFERFKHWDGNTDKHSICGGVFEVFAHQLSQIFLKKLCPKSYRFALWEGYGGKLAPTNWFAYRRMGWLARELKNQKFFSAQEQATDVVAAFQETIALWEKRRGSDPSRWAWGEARPLELKHAFGEAKLFRSIFNVGPVPYGGTKNTIAQCASDPRDLFANPLAIANLRVVVDVGEWDNTRVILSAGQSGNPLSPHYKDMAPLWREGKSVPLCWSDAKVKENTRSELRLKVAAS